MSRLKPYSLNFLIEFKNNISVFGKFYELFNIAP